MTKYSQDVHKCWNVSEKLSVLARISNYLTNAQKFLLVNSDIKPQVWMWYCLLQWMFWSSSAKLSESMKSNSQTCIEIDLSGSCQLFRRHPWYIDVCKWFIDTYIMIDAYTVCESPYNLTNFETIFTK